MGVNLQNAPAGVHQDVFYKREKGPEIMFSVAFGVQWRLEISGFRPIRFPALVNGLPLRPVPNFIMILSRKILLDKFLC